jgi:hypothetical protein
VVDNQPLDLAVDALNRESAGFLRGSVRPDDIVGRTIVHGHFHGGKYADLRAPRITFFRHPVDRMLSQYFLALTRPHGPIGGYIARHRLSVLDFAMIPALRWLYSKVVFGGVDMRSFDVIGSTETYDADIRRVEALLGARLEIQQESSTVSSCDKAQEQNAELRERLSEILADDVRFYQNVMNTR